MGRALLFLALPLSLSLSLPVCVLDKNVGVWQAITVRRFLIATFVVVLASGIGVVAAVRMTQSEPTEPASGRGSRVDETKTLPEGLGWTPLPRATDELTAAELQLAKGLAGSNREVVGAVAGHRWDVVAASLYEEEKRHRTCRVATRNCAEVGIFDYDVNKAIRVIVDLARKEVIAVDFPPGPLAFPLSESELDAASQIALQDAEVQRQLGGRDYRLNAVKQAHLPDVRGAVVAFGVTSESGESFVVFVVVDLAQRKVLQVQLLPTVQ
jgi:hypothetical protein